MFETIISIDEGTKKKKGGWFSTLKREREKYRERILLVLMLRRGAHTDPVTSCNYLCSREGKFKQCI